MRIKDLFLGIVTALSVLFATNHANADYVSYETLYAYRGDHQNRASNIELAARNFEAGIVLTPGQTISFNDLVGPRTYSRGYRNAPTINMGELQEALGGGICQVASTLHAASLWAGLEIVEAHRHSRVLSYIDAGFDSTVVYGHLDLKIRNPFKSETALIFVRFPRRGVLQFRILTETSSTLPEISVVVHRSGWYRTIRNYDPSLPFGTTVIDQKGSKYMDLTRTRTFRDGRSPESFRMVYASSPRIIRYNL
jgi:vancomycin resistance protein YoaR